MLMAMALLQLQARAVRGGEAMSVHPAPKRACTALSLLWKPPAAVHCGGSPARLGPHAWMVFTWALARSTCIQHMPAGCRLRP